MACQLLSGSDLESNLAGATDELPDWISLSILSILSMTQSPLRRILFPAILIRTSLFCLGNDPVMTNMIKMIGDSTLHMVLRDLRFCSVPPPIGTKLPTSFRWLPFA